MNHRFVFPKRKGLPAVILYLGLLVCLSGQPGSVFAGTPGQPVPEFIHLPLINEDPAAPSGTKTTWSCVFFGAYPSAEVVDDDWNAVDDYALQEGDVIRDNALYDRLAQSEWPDNMTVLDDVSYYRAGPDQAPAAENVREQHYSRTDDRPWHYFRIDPIRWRVLDIQDGKALLLADRMPDSVSFHDVDEDITWAECSLRSWLNGYGAQSNRQGIDYSGTGFIDRAFTEKERDAILPVPLRNLSNQDYGTGSGPDTEDCLFILSNEEVFEGEKAGRYGFDPSRNCDDSAKRFTSTLYAKCMGAWWSPVEAYKGNSFWFMRTSGYTPRSVTYVCDFGYIYSKGTLVTCSDAGIVPAMWIDLSLADITDAGERTSTEILHDADNGKHGFDIPELYDPVTVTDETRPDGAYTVWNAVAFGHYPQTEIVPAPAGDMSAADQEASPGLWKQLQEADENKDGEIVLDGVRYLRQDNRWFRFDPIIWRVLEVTDGTALLMADRGLDCVPYHETYTDVFWENCDLRKWLNDSFIEMAFTKEERVSVMTSDVDNDNNYYFGTACGSGTHDRVFILSEAEVFCSEKAQTYGFRPSDALPDAGRQLKPTAYAIARGAWQSGLEATAGIGFWMLRTNGYTEDNAVYVGEKGYLYNRGIPVTCMDAEIVPVVRIQLGKSPVVRVEDISTRQEQAL